MTIKLRLHRRVLAICLFSFSILSAALGQQIDPSMIAGMKWRNIGPFRGGRVSAVTGISTEPDTFYIGLPQGGVWKTTSAGQTWYPVFDGVKDVSAVGSVQVAPSNHSVVYAGTGEISGGGEGNGMYRSDNAGTSWGHVGLDESKIIPTILVDHQDANIIIAATLGDAAAPSVQRGVFRSTDGGRTWAKTLYIDNEFGVQHLAWAYDNPKVVIATSLQRYRDLGKTAADRKPPKDAELFKSNDEGITWTKLNPTGLPKLTGRVTVAVAQGTHSQRMYLIGTFGLYRSDDGGSNWRRMAAEDGRIANGQGFYSSGVYVAANDPDIVYTLATCVYRSTDGGKTFTGFKGAPGGDDPHQMWINPSDATHILLGGDQGATVSLDAGKTWGSWYNQPTGQFYHISTDNRFPYWVYGTQQDSGCIGTSSRGNLGAITPLDWTTHPGNEGGYVVIDPLNPNISYAVGPVGGIIRVTQPSGQWVQIEPNMSPETTLRGGFGPLAFSPTNPHELMMPFQYLLSTVDGGLHWNKLSPDLTVEPNAKPQDPKAPPSSASIFSFSASPVTSGVIWAGTSNGLVWVTRDHGRDWHNVNLSSLPSQRGGIVFHIEASATDPASAYIVTGTFNGREPKPKLYKTHDYGQTWTEIGKNLPKGDQFDRRIAVVRTDPRRSGLLFVLTERRILVSTDDGEHWLPLNMNLPATQMSDLLVRGNDLILGTYGRGIWILDDFAPLRQVATGTANELAHLFRPSSAYRLLRNVNDDTPFPPEVPHAANPPLGAVIYYSLSTKPAGPVSIEIVDGHGTVIRHLSSSPIEPYDDPPPLVPGFWGEDRKPIPTEVGLNRINWNIRYDTPPAFNRDVSDVMGAMAGDTPAAIEGPLALPGEYTVRLIVDGKTYTQPLTIKNDPRSMASSRDLELNHTLRMNIYAGAKEAFEGYNQVATMRKSVAANLDSKPSEAVTKALKDFDEKLAKLGGTVYRERRFYGPPPPDSFANLNGYFLARLDAFGYGDTVPSDSMLSAYGSDWSKLKAVSDRWRAILKKDLAELNKLLAKNNLAQITAPAPALVDPPAPDRRYLPSTSTATSPSKPPIPDGADGANGENP